MNLLLVNYEYPPIGGGGGTATYNLARQMVQAGHEVTVLTAQFRSLSGWALEDGVRVFRCPARRRLADRSSIGEMASFLLSAALTLNSLLKSCRIEGLIAFFSFPCGILGLEGWYGQRIPYVISLRGGDVPGTEPGLRTLHNVLRPLRRWAFRCSRAVVANSIGLKTLSEDHFNRMFKTFNEKARESQDEAIDDFMAYFKNEEGRGKLNIMTLFIILLALFSSYFPLINMVKKTSRYS